MIGIVDQPIANALDWTVCPPVRWLSSRFKVRYLADPFPWPGRSDIILCENYDFATSVGSIHRLGIKNGRIISEAEQNFSFSCHLSFPFLFMHEGEVYAMPESAAAQELSIFCWKETEQRWKKIATPLSGVAAADSVIFEEGGYFWIAYTDANLGAWDNLNLIYASSLTGSWRPHAANPVIRGLQHSRCGGTPFRKDGKLYRPAQDCTKRYGGALRIMRITECSIESFREEEATQIQPAHGKNPHGFHHLSAWGDKCLVDGKRMMFSPTMVLDKAMRRLLRTMDFFSPPASK